MQCLVPGGWIAIVDINNLLSGHHPMPEEIRASFLEFEKCLCVRDQYDCNMGGKLPSFCREAGLTVISKHSHKDAELAFEGSAPSEILAAWRERFKRMQGMKSHFGETHFEELVSTFLDTIASSDHHSTATVEMVLATRPK